MRFKTLITVVLACGLSAGAGYYAANVRAADETSNYERDEGDMDLIRDDLLDQIRVVAEKYKEIAQNVDPANQNDDANKAREEQINKILQPLQLDLYGLLLQTHMLVLDTIADKSGEAFLNVAREKVLIEHLGAKKEDVAKYQKEADLGFGGMIIGYAIAKAGNVAPSEVFTQKTDSAQSWLQVMKKHNLVFTDLVTVLDGAFD